MFCFETKWTAVDNVDWTFYYCIEDEERAHWQLKRIHTHWHIHVYDVIIRRTSNNNNNTRTHRHTVCECMRTVIYICTQTKNTNKKFSAVRAVTELWAQSRAEQWYTAVQWEINIQWMKIRQLVNKITK